VNGGFIKRSRLTSGYAIRILLAEQVILLTYFLFCTTIDLTGILVNHSQWALLPYSKLSISDETIQQNIKVETIKH
jgi:hypothetical protein